MDWVQTYVRIYACMHEIFFHFMDFWGSLKEGGSGGSLVSYICNAT